MRKNILIGLAAIMIIILAIIVLIFAFGNSYPANMGDVNLTTSNVTLKYNNDKCGIYTYTNEYGKTESLYYDNKYLEGQITIDLSNVKWSEEFNESFDNPNNGSYFTDSAYANDYFLEDIQNDFNTNLNKTVSIEYYNKSTPVGVDDNSVKKNTTIIKDMSLNGNILTINFYKDYQLDTTTPVRGESPYKGVLLYGRQSSVNGIDNAKLKIEFSNENYTYLLNVDIPQDKFNLTHM